MIEKPAHSTLEISKMNHPFMCHCPNIKNKHLKSIKKRMHRHVQPFSFPFWRGGGGGGETKEDQRGQTLNFPPQNPDYFPTTTVMKWLSPILKGEEIDR